QGEIILDTCERKTGEDSPGTALLPQQAPPAPAFAMRSSFLLLLIYAIEVWIVDILNPWPAEINLVCRRNHHVEVVFHSPRQPVQQAELLKVVFRPSFHDQVKDSP